MHATLNKNHEVVPEPDTEEIENHSCEYCESGIHCLGGYEVLRSLKNFPKCLKAETLRSKIINESCAGSKS